MEKTKRRRDPSLDSPSMRRILDVLKRHGAMSLDDLACEACVSLKTLIDTAYLPRLVEANAIHVIRWEQREDTTLCPIYGFGPGENAPRPKKVITVGMRAILDLLADVGPLTASEIAKTLGFSLTTINGSRFLRGLKHKDLVHISAWRISPVGPPVAVYKIGSGQDAAPAARMSEAQRKARYRNRKAGLPPEGSVLRSVLHSMFPKTYTGNFAHH